MRGMQHLLRSRWQVHLPGHLAVNRILHHAHCHPGDRCSPGASTAPSGLGRFLGQSHLELLMLGAREHVRHLHVHSHQLDVAHHCAVRHRPAPRLIAQQAAAAVLVPGPHGVGRDPDPGVNAQPEVQLIPGSHQRQARGGGEGSVEEHPHGPGQQRVGAVVAAGHGEEGGGGGARRGLVREHGCHRHGADDELVGLSVRGDGGRSPDSKQRTGGAGGHVRGGETESLGRRPHHGLS
mmetsp:Transcript_26941/g.66033  ORF Transcript_26941/g.66033 Transcript_26941/m.66033 type:complete len:236 (-) Transcript_26941:239-946(-)